MTLTNTAGTVTAGRAFKKEMIVAGKPANVDCVIVNGQTYSISSKLLRVATIEEEWHQDVTQPEEVIAQLAQCRPKPDLFTFWQRVPDREPKYDYHKSWESLAVADLTKGYDHWWNKQVKGTTRNMVRKSEKAGVVTRECAMDDQFVAGLVELFNESPVRQGFPFWHYGKDAATIKREFSRFLFREDIVGAYLGDELIGFTMMANAGKYGMVGMFLAKIKHRDKAVNNALMAKTVEVCCKRNLPYLTYTTFRQTSLVDFKRHNGFEEFKVPRYFVPLTPKGQLALKLGFSKYYNENGWLDALPPSIKEPLKSVRKRYYAIRYGSR
jgi:hypothetical protein